MFVVIFFAAKKFGADEVKKAYEFFSRLSLSTLFVITTCGCSMTEKNENQSMNS